MQRLCSICYSDSCPSSQAQNEIRLLPSNWSRKLLHEILSFETVRDSTLRRSTGYGLGFLSILRSEEVSPRFLFPQILSNILKTCLPSSTVMREQMQKWKTSENEMFVYCKKMSVAHFISDEMYQVGKIQVFFKTYQCCHSDNLISIYSFYRRSDREFTP